jgi:16S rRNA (guanine1207-N2)-methyltransferase
MTDAPTIWLIQQIQQSATSQSIWFSDENVLRQLPDSKDWIRKPTLITNRWDIAEQAKQSGFITQFNDFELTAITDDSIDHIFYRISKEKAVTHHLINQAARILSPSGILWLSGQKNEGIKTYIEKASALFGCGKQIEKNGMGYSARLQKKSITNHFLNDENYSELRACLEIDDKTVFSKPGQFGWNKIDQGSKYLIDEVAKLIESGKHFNHCLDLGCGYGFLTIASTQFSIKSHTLTDNNAAALIAARYNCARLEIDAVIVESDAGRHLEQCFDLILCNPPFHQGFSVDGDLTDKFLRSASRLLLPNGVAYFVVNQFIPLEKKASAFFKSVVVIAQNKSFKVIQLHKN